MSVPLHVQAEGPRDAPVLVLLHAVGTSGAMWDPQVGPLAEQFRVLRMDARGHGGSPATPVGAPVMIGDLGTDVLAALDRLEIGQAHIAGLSLGGMTAMWLAINHPERVGRLALLCTSAHPGARHAWLDRAAAVRAGGMVAVSEMVVDRWITPDLKARDAQLYAWLTAILVGTDGESYARCCEMLAALDLRADLGRIAVPTLVVGGAQDPALPLDHQRVIADAIHGARLASVEPAAHLANIEQVGAVTELLRRHFGA